MQSYMNLNQKSKVNEIYRKMIKVRLDKYTNTEYNPGSLAKRVFWYLTSLLIFKTHFPFPSVFKVFCLRCFGANMGSKIVIKPNVNIKYPWFLSVNNNTWIGEDVWIDNLTNVDIGQNVCLSQGSYLLTGSHDYKKETFNLRLGKIALLDGVWIGAKSIVCPGVTCFDHSVLTAGSIATGDMNSYHIYQGNPAVAKRFRQINVD